MTLFNFRYRVESARNPNWDYHSQGYYFVTICTQNKIHYFGSVINRRMILSPVGNIAQSELLKTPEIRDNVVIDQWVIMPNHIHVIFKILPASPVSLQAHRGASPVSVETHRGGFAVETHRGAFDVETHRGAFDVETHRGGFDVETHRGGFDVETHRGGFDVETHRGASLQTNDIRTTNRKTTNQQKNHFGPQSNNLPAIVRGFKSMVKKWTNIYGLEFNWQASYHDHIIRNEKELFRIRRYILNNINAWSKDS